MNNKIGDIVSRIRGQLKAVRQDAFLTDRFIYSIILKHVKWLVKREDSAHKMLRYTSALRTLDYVPLVEVDKIEAGCIGLETGYTFMRTKEKINVFLKGYYCPLISSVTSIDGSVELQETTPSHYLSISSSKNFKFNKTKYYWFINDHMYFPDVVWPAVRVQGIPEDDISGYKCPDGCECEDSNCIPRYDQEFNVPDYLHGELEAQVMKDLTVTLQIPSDPVHDNQNPLK